MVYYDIIANCYERKYDSVVCFPQLHQMGKKRNNNIKKNLQNTLLFSEAYIQFRDEIKRSFADEIVCAFTQQSTYTGCTLSRYRYT